MNLSTTGIGFAAYLGLVLGIGVWAWRRTRDIADYLIGGRRVGAAVAALSAGASDMSGWLLLGLPGLAVSAPPAAVWTALGLMAGVWGNWRYVAGPLREHSRRLGAITLPDFFARRFPGRAAALRAVAALAIVLFYLLYTSAGLVAAGKLFNSVFDVPYALAVGLGAAVVLLYTLFGGFLAVAWTDAFQALLMAAALALVAALLWRDGGTPGTAADWLAVEKLAGLSALAWGLGYAGQPHILTRFMAMDAAAPLARARAIGLSWTAFGLVAAILVGTGGAGLVADGGDPERVFILAIEALLDPWIAGLCLAAILAAIMSTADSQLLVAASALAEDLVAVVRQRPLEPARRLRAG
ncbi:MAG: sodium:solute symporter family transporter, partial [Gammaproteobacteria bacterium]